MSANLFSKFKEKSLEGKPLSDEECLSVLNTKPENLLELLNAAYQVRYHSFQNLIKIHILNNAQNGACPEDCHYCAQSTSSTAPIEEYPIKSDAEIISEAKNAYEKGAYRYCMVFSGKEPSMERIHHLAELVKTIKSQYPLEVCVSPGTITSEMAKILREAGLDRINHNINTSEKFYEKICTTHSYQERLNTLLAATSNNLKICSGVILGMGEQAEDILAMARTLGEQHVASIPVNFFIPIEGTKLKYPDILTPQFCLKALCLFRFMNPTAEIRVAAGRELHFRSLEALAFYPANSLFLEGYLNVKGSTRLQTLQMLKDAGFEIESNFSLDELLQKEGHSLEEFKPTCCSQIKIKDHSDLHLKGL